MAVVAHGGVVRTAVGEAMDLPQERIFSLDVGYGRLCVVDWFDGTAVVRLLNGSAGDVPGPALGDASL